MRTSGIGGQAVLEGIMMKNKEAYAVAVRTMEGTIAVERHTYKGIFAHPHLKDIPFVRGVFAFVDSLVLGMRSLSVSASYFDEEPKKDGGRDRIIMASTMLFSVAAALCIFMLLPYWIGGLLTQGERKGIVFSVTEGVIRLLLFFLYLALISRMKDIRRTFMYHGAEHKCINCIETGKELTVDNVRKSSRRHKRCGTSFLFFVMIVSVILCFFITADTAAARLLLRLALLPVVAGISYELIRLAGRTEHPLINALSAPGMWVQSLTTLEPDDSMIEVAIAAVEAVFDWRSWQKESL